MADLDIIAGETPAETGQQAAAPEKTQLDVLREAIRTAPESTDDGEGDDEDASGAESVEPAAGADTAAAAPAAVDGGAAAKPPTVAEDELYKMPDGLQAKSQERFRQLVDNSKTLAAQVQERDGQISQMREATDWLRTEVLTDDDAPADLVQFASYRKAMRSGDFGTARQIIQEQVRQLALASGQPIDVDPLSGHSDLRQRVDGMELSEQDAMELARSRQQQAAQSRMLETRQQEAVRQQEYRQHAEQAVSQVEAMCADWRSKDIDWPAKEKILMEQMPVIMQSYAPHQIPGQIMMLYDTLSRAMPAAQRQQAVTAPTPLRGAGRAAGTAAPASALDAMRQKLGY